MTVREKHYYRIHMGAIKKGGFKPMVVLQVGDGYDAYVYNYARNAWVSNVDLFVRRVEDGDQLTRTEISEAEARNVIREAGGTFDGAPLVKG